MTNLRKVTEIRLADVVRLWENDAWSDAIVEKINKDNGTVHLVRPYMHHADYSYTGGVITYIGHEHLTYLLTDKYLFNIVRYGGILK